MAIKLNSMKIFEIFIIFAASVSFTFTNDMTISCKKVENQTEIKSCSPEKIIDGTTNIKLSDDIIKKIDEFYVEDVSLTILPTFTKHDSLKHFIWINSKLTEINPKSLENFKELIYVNFKDNLLTSINDSTFNNNLKLEKINLNGNKLKNIASDAFKNLPKLTEIDLSMNDIFELNPKIFIRNYELETIDLGINYIKSLPVTIFHSLSKLKTLILSYNSIEALPDRIFAHNNKLEVLDISYNHIMKIGHQNLPVFKKVDISKLGILSNNCTENTGIDNAAENLDKIVNEYCKANCTDTYKWMIDELSEINFSEFRKYVEATYKKNGSK